MFTNRLTFMMSVRFDTALGARVRTGLSADDNALQLDSATDRISDEELAHENIDGALWLVSRSYLYPQAGNATRKLIATHRTKLAGFGVFDLFGATDISRSEDIDIAGNTTMRITTLHGAVRASGIIYPGITKNQTTVTHAGRLMSVSVPGVTDPETYGYDALGREISHQDPRHSQASTTAYIVGKNQIASETDAAGNSTSYSYHPQGVLGAGRIRSVTLADSSVMWNSYTQDGELMASWGSQTNPTWRVYDAYGQLQQLHTWQTAPTLNADAMPGSIPAGSAITTWHYDAASGLLTSKRDADNKGADYQYNITGRLTQRQWARSSGGNRLSTTYAYNGFDNLTAITYSDSTPNAAITYDRIGRTYSAGNGVAGSIYDYDPATLGLNTETVSYDLNGDSVADITRVIGHSQDALRRPTGWQLKDGAIVENSVGYAYFATDGRLASVANTTDSFEYSYLPSSYLLSAIVGPAHTVTNTYEANRNVLSQKQNKVGATTVSSYEYTVNAIGQRMNVEQTGTAFASSRDTAWTYDSLGQVIGADSSIPAHNRAYQYDAIGNRKKSADSLTLPGSDNYVANALNQYTAVNAINPAYDADGNATAYPVPAHPGSNSTLVWDAENRLVSATVNGVTSNYRYDAFSRRIATTTGVNTTAFVYDAWNPIAEYTTTDFETFDLQRSYTWGTDLSGTLQGAGGVGGLLAVKTGSTSHYPTYDGNGNVSEYLDSTGAIAAHYEYDPFGRTVVASGAKAGDFAHRFSTKPIDQATGFYYYGYRFYDPLTGRWPSRDPIGERGGVNLYGFVYNNPKFYYDYLGGEPRVTQDANRQWHDAGGRYTNTPSNNVTPANSTPPKGSPPSQDGLASRESVAELGIDALSTIAEQLAYKQAQTKCEELFKNSECGKDCPKSCTWSIAGTRAVQGGGKPVDQWYFSGATTKCKSCASIASDKLGQTGPSFESVDQFYNNPLNQELEGKYVVELGPKTGCIDG